MATVHKNSSVTTLVAEEISTLPSLAHNDLEQDIKDFVKPTFNIEQSEVDDDPRNYSDRKKTMILSIVAATALIGILAGNIFFPAINSLQIDLRASDQLISASVSLFILGQGLFPMIWSSISEVKGRKLPYIISLTIFCAASAACALSKSIGMFLAFRVLQALGSSSVLSVGAASLCDIYDPSVRGMKLGIYYAIPLLGPSIGPLIGGAITSKGDWRDTFWFVLAYGLVCLLLMALLPETHRPERSMAWQAAAKRSRQQILDKKASFRFNQFTLDPKFSPDHTCTPPTPAQLEKGLDLTKLPTLNFTSLVSKLSKTVSSKNLEEDQVLEEVEEVIKVTLKDANPFPPIIKILSQKHNICSILSSAILFASQYTISFTTSRAFSARPYSYNSLVVGLILLSYGAGNILGSVAGGRYSDSILRKLKQENGGQSEPEMRIKSTHIPLFILPPFFIIYAWLVESTQTIHGIVLTLFVLGFATISIYSSTLAYVVDSNPGRSGSAVATNSLVRGICAAVASQVAEPLIKLIGTGYFYTAFAFIILGGEVLLLLVSKYGGEWRIKFAAQELENELKKEQKRRGSADTVC